jgi:hypothetical protein
LDHRRIKERYFDEPCLQSAFHGWNWVVNSTGGYAGSDAQDSTQIRKGNGNTTNNPRLTINNFNFESRDTDRSFGARPTAVYDLVNAHRITNNTGFTLTQFSLGYRLVRNHLRTRQRSTNHKCELLHRQPHRLAHRSLQVGTFSQPRHSVYSSDSLTAVNNVYGNAAGKFNMLAPTTVTGIN